MSEFNWIKQYFWGAIELCIDFSKSIDKETDQAIFETPVPDTPEFNLGLTNIGSSNLRLNFRAKPNPLAIKKKPLHTQKLQFKNWVDDGVRTHDPRYHKPML